MYSNVYRDVITLVQVQIYSKETVEVSCCFYLLFIFHVNSFVKVVLVELPEEGTGIILFDNYCVSHGFSKVSLESTNGVLGL